MEGQQCTCCVKASGPTMVAMEAPSKRHRKPSSTPMAVRVPNMPTFVGTGTAMYDRPMPVKVAVNMLYRPLFSPSISGSRPKSARKDCMAQPESHPVDDVCSENPMHRRSCSVLPGSTCWNPLAMLPWFTHCHQAEHTTSSARLMQQ